ncbi:hypothetical protein [Halorientalis sp. IM1011]|uniref:hypothetical protein n=1 Tax=Halorientalis sp. IM1011 TaxID=1932360 RepID=UPI0012FC5E9D|nr:hypothetical protein [Halorientalis sp. IM1011]
MTLTIAQRVAAARELLSGWSEAEFESLSVQGKVDLMEAVDYLESFDEVEAGNR